jgi:hypothetical protein
MKVYRLKITLQGITPPIWRRIEVESQHTLNNLHLMIQAAFGWSNCHLHAFQIANREYTYRFDDESSESDLDEREYTLEELLGNQVPQFQYIYDFGDHWRHLIEVEELKEGKPGVAYPICLAGKRASPPEDCGSVPGYYKCLEVLSNPNSLESRRLIDWMGPYDPERCDLDEVNVELSNWEEMVSIDNLLFD